MQAALDQLCQLIGVNDEPGIHVKSVFTVDRANNEQPFTPLENDSDVDFEALAAGIMVQCDEPLFINSLRGKPTCFVTLEMPYPFNSIDRRMWSEGEGDNDKFPVIGFNPLVLDGETMFAVSDENDGGGTARDPSQLHWRPTRRTARWLRSQLFEMIRELGLFSETRQGRVLARLTLKGNFIWSQKDPELYLDGQAFGVHDETELRTALRLPSGDGKRGGDFEMWFWLVTFRLDLEPREVNRGQASAGVVTLLGGPAPEGGARILLDSENPDVAEPGVRSVTIKAGETSARFPITAKAPGAAVIRSRYAGAVRSQTLSVNSDTMRITAVRLLATDGVFDTSDPQVVAEMENPSASVIVPSSSGFDVIEVTFSESPSINSVVNGQTFIVRDARSNTIPALPGRIIRTGENVVRWGATQGVPSNNYDVVLVSDIPGARGIVAESGTRLDGEPTQLPSGDGTQGGNFAFRLRILSVEPVRPQPLKIRSVRILRVRNAEDANARVLFDMQQMPPRRTVTVQEQPNAIEVEFVGAQLNIDSVISGATFIVQSRSTVGGRRRPPERGHIVSRERNIVRWVTGALGQPPPLLTEPFYDITLAGIPRAGEPRTITALDNTQLDGEPTQLPSGNNEPGGDFTFALQTPPQ